MPNLPIKVSEEQRQQILHACRLEMDRRACLRLSEFVKRGWHVLEPTTPLVWGKVLDVMCAELESVYHNPGFQPRLLCNVPPGTLKSMLWSVMFPAWVWTQNPTKSFTGVAHEQGLAIRDARKMRLLVESDWYQERWPLAMASDANAKTLFENEHRGFRQAVPFKSMTGRRSDYVIVDDPHSAEDANSPAYRNEAARIFRETLPTRVNNDDSAILIIMQRLHEEDISGLILADEEKFGYRPLILPMHFDPTRADPRDWRTQDGELLFPERFSARSVENLERTLGAYAAAGQLEQRPVPREGGMFKLSWFDGKYLNSVPAGTRWIRWWDLAGSKDTNSAYTAGALLGKTPDGAYVIGGVRRFQEEYMQRDKNIREQCELDKAQFGSRVKFYIPKDPGAGGKMQWQSLIKFLDGFDVSAVKEVGEKEDRAGPFSGQCEAGNVYILGEYNTPWVKEFLDELTMFPGGKFKDQVDAVVNAYGRFLAEPKKKIGLAGAMPVDMAA